MDVDAFCRMAEKIARESEKEMENHERFTEYLKPLFKQKFGVEYDPSLTPFYDIFKRNFIDTHWRMWRKLNG